MVFVIMKKTYFEAADFTTHSDIAFDRFLMFFEFVFGDNNFPELLCSMNEIAS